MQQLTEAFPAAGLQGRFKASGLYSADVRNYSVPNAVEMANKLLDEAGFPRKADGICFEMVHDIIPYGEEWQRFGEAVQQQLAQVGIKATLRYEDVPTRAVFGEDALALEIGDEPVHGAQIGGRFHLRQHDAIHAGTHHVHQIAHAQGRADLTMALVQKNGQVTLRMKIWHPL